ncbi:MAG: hypothetical protein IRZ29_09810 [Thermoflavifilum sp.]|nr:hypothetical protein [Thermoflavifilum sp.]
MSAKHEVSAANLGLSPQELELVQNQEWIHLKNQIIQKAIALMGQLHHTLQESLKGWHLPEVWLQPGAKISRGERYEGLPYVILDFPRFFSQHDVLACRSLFWWGNYFTCTLHISGKFLQQYRPALEAHFEWVQRHDWWVSCGQEQWSHRVHNTANYLPLRQLSQQAFASLLQQQSFLKLVKSYPLQEWNGFVAFAVEHYCQLLRCLGMAPDADNLQTPDSV